MTAFFPFYLNLEHQFASLSNSGILHCAQISTDLLTDLCEVSKRDISTYFVCKQKTLDLASARKSRTPHSEILHLNDNSLMSSNIPCRHQSNVRIGSSLNICPECPVKRVFTSRGTLKKHIQNCHGRKPHCPYCKQQIRTDNMSRHIRKYCPKAVQMVTVDEEKVQKYLLDARHEAEVTICLNGISIL